MDAQEVKDRLQSVINALIKDQPEEATKELHDVLAAKMRNRISPEEATNSDDDISDDVTSDDEELVDTSSDE